MSVASETFPSGPRAPRGPSAPPVPVQVSPDLIEGILDGAPGRVVNTADLGLRRMIAEEVEKRRVGKESNLRSVAELKRLIADGRRDLTKLRAQRAAAINALVALYGKDGSPSPDMFAEVELTPGASGAGVGTAVILAKREHDRVFDQCEVAKRDLVHWELCLAETEHRLESGFFDKPSVREQQLRASVAEWEQRLEIAHALFDQPGQAPRRRRFLG